MSAIAFYDSGRLLPLRHELKQKQIEQRNLDAENTRRYIGLAGRGFANMAERTGTVFGARLGSAPTDAKGVEVDRPYGGGTIGAKASKAEWQKGTMDSESKRREVSHRLGLLMKHVEFGNADRKRRAWGNRDDAALQSEFNNRFTIFSKYATDTSIQREELIQRWPDFFTQTTKDRLKEIRLGGEDKQEELLIEFRSDPKFAPIMRFMKYAEEQNWYNPKVLEEEFEGLTMLTNYLQQEVGFTGMNRGSKVVQKEKKKEEKVGDPYANPKEIIKRLEDDTKGTEFEKNKPVSFITPGAKKKKPLTIWEVATQDVPKVGEDGEELGGVEQWYQWGVNVVTDLKKLTEQNPEYNATNYAEEAANAKKRIEDEATQKAYEQMANWSEEKDGPKQPFADKIEAGKNKILAEVEALFSPLLKYKEDFLEFMKPATEVIQSAAQSAEDYLDLDQGTIYGLMSGLSDEQIKIAEAQAGKTIKKPVVNTETKPETDRFDLLVEEADKRIEKQAFIRKLSKVDDTTPHNQMSLEDIIGNTRHFEDNRPTGDKLASSAGYLIDDYGGRPILPGAVNLNYHLQHLPMHKRIGKANRVIDMIGGFEKGTEKRKMLLEYMTSNNIKDIFGYDTSVTSKDKLTEAQRAARRMIKFTPDQVDKLVDYTWKDHLQQLNDNHKYLNAGAYSSNPYLKHILGDMAYRLGPNFIDMKKKIKGVIVYPYKEFGKAVEDLIKAPDRDESAHLDAWTRMRSNFVEKYPKNPNDRYKFLLNRFEMLKAIITKGKYVGQGTYGIGLHEKTPLEIKPKKVKKSTSNKYLGGTSGMTLATEGIDSGYTPLAP